MPSSQLFRLGVGTAIAGTFLLASTTPTVDAHSARTVPRVQMIGLSMSLIGTTGVRAVVQPSNRALSAELPKGRWWVGLVGASTWNPPPATFIEAGLSRGLNGDAEAHPYAASQVLSQTYELVLYRQLVLASEVPHVYKVERIRQGADALWQASFCDLEHKCTVLLRTRIPENSLPFALIGGESNGIGWDVLHARQTQRRLGDSVNWPGWCYHPAWAHVTPEGAGDISQCIKHAWSLLRPLDAPLVETAP